MTRYELLLIKVIGFACHILYAMLSHAADWQFVVTDHATADPGFVVTEVAYVVPPKPVVVPVAPQKPAPLTMGNQWFVGGRNTSISHLIQAHGYTREQLAPYANDPAMLNRIHGAAHEGRAKTVQQRQATAAACPTGGCPTGLKKRR